ncbi:MAG: hypothetical protein HAW67_00585 [Endozoicomonadaceae bacterium]|nr:hypothetical protein [Endozoicomonadaceae bacterium]
MTDINFLAFQSALGLLSDAEKKAIEPTGEFNQALKKWQLHLNRLNARAPLEQQSADKIWQEINQQIKPEKTNPVAAWLASCAQSWRYALSGFAGLSVLISVSLFNQTANAGLGWDIDTNASKQQVVVTTTTHQHTSKTKKCTLWVKNGDKILLIGAMPETGEKILNVNAEILTMIQTGEMIISLESKDGPASSPDVVQHWREWSI